LKEKLKELKAKAEEMKQRGREAVFWLLVKYLKL